MRARRLDLRIRPDRCRRPRSRPAAAPRRHRPRRRSVCRRNRCRCRGPAHGMAGVRIRRSRPVGGSDARPGDRRHPQSARSCRRQGARPDLRRRGAPLMAHVLLAGGAGFIGSHMTDRLLDRGDTVVCVDDLSTGSRDHTRAHAKDDRYWFVDRDITLPGLADAIGGDKFDVVMNLASPASPPAYLARPIATLDTGSIGTRALLEIAVRDGARFFLASTSEVYGDPLEHPQVESYWGNVNPIGERSVYDEAKRFAEAITAAYGRVHGLEVRIARIFNTYGPRMQFDDGRVVTNLVHQALTGEPLTLYGDGSQTRSFCYVDDEVTGLLALLDGPIDTPVNIGNPQEVTMRELAELVLELTGSPSTVMHMPLPADDPRVRKPDISLARQVLGWEPVIDLRDGLTRTIAYHRAGL